MVRSRVCMKSAAQTQERPETQQSKHRVSHPGRKPAGERRLAAWGGCFQASALLSHTPRYPLRPARFLCNLPSQDQARGTPHGTPSLAQATGQKQPPVQAPISDPKRTTHLQQKPSLEHSRKCVSRNEWQQMNLFPITSLAF